MRRVLFGVGLLLALLALAACGGQTAEPAEAPEPETVEVEVTRVVEVEGETVVETETIVVTATPEPVAAQDTMVICMAQEPNSLIWTESALVTSAVLEAVQEPLIDALGFEYQANLVEKLPSFDDGDATLEEVTVGEGDIIYDVASDNVLTLTAGMTETFSLNQLEGDPIEVSEYAGEELTTVQTTAQWTLLDGLTWEDGTPVTAEDSVFAFNLIGDPNWPLSKYLYDRTASYSALDERTMQWVGLPGYTDGTYFINVWDPKPRQQFEGMSAAEILEDESANRDPLGYGAYLVDDWVSGESVTLSANSNYVKGTPPLATLIYRFVPDTNALVAQLASGECDVGTQDAAFEGSLPLIRGFEEQGLMEVVETAGTVFEHFDFNILPVEGYGGAAATLVDNEGGRLFANPQFRQAIAYCVDRVSLIDQATNGAGFIQHTYTAENHPLFPGNDAITVYDFNPEQGLALLEELGYTLAEGSDVLTNAQGQELAFIHSSRRNPLREKVTQIAQAQLAENCFIKTEIQLEGSEYFADGPEGTVFGRKYDMGEFAWLTGVEPPCNLYLSSQIPSEELGWGGANNTGWQNDEFDAACNAAIQTLDPEVKAEQHAEAMRIFTEELPSLPLFARAKIAVVRPGVEGVMMDPTANSELFNVENFSFSE